MTAYNFLGYTDDAYSNSKTVSLAKLGIPAPDIYIQGENPVTTLTHSTALSLQASAALPSLTCVDTSKLRAFTSLHFRTPMVRCSLFLFFAVFFFCPDLANAKMSFLWYDDSGFFTDQEVN
jgi:hypothetical protein